MNLEKRNLIDRIDPAAKSTEQAAAAATVLESATVHTQKVLIFVTLVGLAAIRAQFKAQRGEGLFKEVESGATVVEKDRSHSGQFAK